MDNEPNNAPQTDIDIVHRFRDRIYMVLGLAMVPFLGAFSIYSAIQREQIMALSTAVIISLAVVNAIHFARRGRRLIPNWIVYGNALFATAWGIVVVSPMVAFWCYPIAIVTLFVADRKQGILYTLLAIAIIFPCAFAVMRPDTFARFAVTYVMACYFGYLVVGLLERMQSQMTTLAITDPLTGAFNRRYFDDVFATAVEQYRRGLGQISLIMLDIDHFKQINDRYGHATGDRVLIELVKLLRSRIRAVDTLFRTGGEEFSIIARGISYDDAIDLAQSIRQLTENSELAPDSQVTISIGVAQYEEPEPQDRLLLRADKHLYEAKRQGRNRVCPAKAA